MGCPVTAYRVAISPKQGIHDTWTRVPVVQVCPWEPSTFHRHTFFPIQKTVDMKLTDRSILTTGGATGIGLALARQLSGRGNRVVICGSNDHALRQAKVEIPALIIRVCDVTDITSRQSMVNWLANVA